MLSPRSSTCTKTLRGPKHFVAGTLRSIKPCRSARHSLVVKSVSHHQVLLTRVIPRKVSTQKQDSFRSSLWQNMQGTMPDDIDISRSARCCIMDAFTICFGLIILPSGQRWSILHEYAEWSSLELESLEHLSPTTCLYEALLRLLLKEPQSHVLHQVLIFSTRASLADGCNLPIQPYH